MRSQKGVRVVLHIGGVPVVALTASGELQPSSAVARVTPAADAVKHVGDNMLETTVVVDSVSIPITELLVVCANSREFIAPKLVIFVNPRRACAVFDDFPSKFSSYFDALFMRLFTCSDIF